MPESGFKAAAPCLNGVMSLNYYAISDWNSKHLLVYLIREMYRLVVLIVVGLDVRKLCGHLIYSQILLFR